MKPNEIAGYGEKVKFDAVDNGNIIEFCLIGAKETIVSCTYPDGREKSFTLANSYIAEAIRTGRLKAKLAAQWLVQRDEDHKYYGKSNRWVKDPAKAQVFEADTIDSVISVMHDRNYRANKVAV